jgi:predicted nucleotidyltransferase
MSVSAEDIAKALGVLKRCGATRVVVFGSAAEQPENARDLDLACEGIKGWIFFEALGRLQEELLVPVELVDLSVESRFGQHILKKGKVLYERS